MTGFTDFFFFKLVTLSNSVKIDTARIYVHLYMFCFVVTCFLSHLDKRLCEEYLGLILQVLILYNQLMLITMSDF